MGLQPQHKTGLNLTFWAGINRVFLTVLSSFVKNVQGRKRLLPTGFRRGWDKSVRKVRSVHIRENNIFLRVLSPPYRIIVGLRTVLSGNIRHFLRIKLINRR